MKASKDRVRLAGMAMQALIGQIKPSNDCTTEYMREVIATHSVLLADAVLMKLYGEHKWQDEVLTPAPESSRYKGSYDE